MLEATEETHEMCHKIFSIHLQSIPGSKICRICFEFLQTASDFKLMTLESETQLLNFLKIKEEPVEVEETENIFCELVDAGKVPLVHEEDTNDDFEWKDSEGSSYEEETQAQPAAKKNQKKSSLQQCPLCDKKVKGLKRHLTLQHQSERPTYVECKICHKTFRSMSIGSHMKIHENDPCPICDRQLSKAAMPLHLLRHKKPSEITAEERERFAKHYCAICNSFTLQLEQHNKTVHSKTAEKVSCDICGETMNRSKLNFHIQWNHCGPYTCDLCSKIFKNKVYIRSHIEHFHLRIKNVSCSICQKAFYNGTGLTSHMKMHHQTPEFICPQCGKGFAYKKALSVHIEAVHIKSGSVKCQDCGAKYNSKSALQYHVSTAHSNDNGSERKFGEFCGKCVCGEEFFSRASFTQHLHADHKKEDGRYYCPCGRDYISKPKLTVHFERYHKISAMFHKKKKPLASN